MITYKQSKLTMLVYGVAKTLAMLAFMAVISVDWDTILFTTG